MTRHRASYFVAAFAATAALGLAFARPDTPASVRAVAPAANTAGATAPCTMVGYDRRLFGTLTKTTRARVTRRDSLTDHYTGTQLTKADRPQLDHVVALADAWRSGACHWAPAVRKTFATDKGRTECTPVTPCELRWTAGRTNESKSDQTPAEWSPIDRGHACLYGREYLAIKTVWALTIAAADRAAVEMACGG